MRICKVNNCDRSVFGGDYCKSHQYLRTDLKLLKKKNTPLKKSYLSKKTSEKQVLKNIEKKERTKKLHAWFITEIWDKRPHYSELSLKWLGNEPNTCFFHHIFCKSSHPDLEFVSDNIIQLTADEHADVESNPTKFHLINTKREEIRIKYGK
tara:strand:+ start:10779 stop:11234 length:456 start_codon:yes stop_codon:yes gene_type:complete